MELPLQSICVPAYNVERYLHACLDAVSHQTYPNLELIIVDDGSLDRTYEVASAFVAENEARFTRVELLRQDNRGVSATCNRLLELARGEWIHFAHSDDVLYPRKVQSQWEAVQSWQADDLALVYGDVDEIDAEGRLLISRTVNRPLPGPQRHAYEQLLRRNSIYTPTVSLRRTALLELGGFDTNLDSEDLDCWLRLSRKYAISRVPEVMCGYRMHGANLSKKKTQMLVALLETHAKFLANYGSEVSSSTQQACFQKDLHRVYRWAKKNRRSALLPLLCDWMGSFFRTPPATSYLELAQMIRATGW